MVLTFFLSRELRSISGEKPGPPDQSIIGKNRNNSIEKLLGKTRAPLKL